MTVFMRLARGVTDTHTVTDASSLAVAPVLVSFLVFYIVGLVHSLYVCL